MNGAVRDITLEQLRDRSVAEGRGRRVPRLSSLIREVRCAGIRLFVGKEEKMYF